MSLNSPKLYSCILFKHILVLEEFYFSYQKDYQVGPTPCFSLSRVLYCTSYCYSKENGDADILIQMSGAGKSNAKML